MTGVLAALGLRNLPGILVLTPVEAMLLASFGSWHPHDGRGDWLVPPLIQAAEYVFLAEVGFALRRGRRGRSRWSLQPGSATWTWPTGCACGLASGIDRRGLGWEGRMIVVGVAAAAGGLIVVYPALTVYLWWLNARDWVVGWSARPSAGHAAVDG